MGRKSWTKVSNQLALLDFVLMLFIGDEENTRKRNIVHSGRIPGVDYHWNPPCNSCHRGPCHVFWSNRTAHEQKDTCQKCNRTRKRCGWPRGVVPEKVPQYHSTTKNRGFGTSGSSRAPSAPVPAASSDNSHTRFFDSAGAGLFTFPGGAAPSTFPGPFPASSTFVGSSVPRPHNLNGFYHPVAFPSTPPQVILSSQFGDVDTLRMELEAMRTRCNSIMEALLADQRSRPDFQSD